MSAEQIRPLPTCHVASVAVVIGAVSLYLWTSGAASNASPEAAVPASVSVSVSLLDMSRLVPAEFGDWETAASARVK